MVITTSAGSEPIGLVANGRDSANVYYGREGQDEHDPGFYGVLDDIVSEEWPGISWPEAINAGSRNDGDTDWLDELNDIFFHGYQKGKAENWSLMNIMGPKSEEEGYVRTGNGEDIKYGNDFRLDGCVDANGKYTEGYDFRFLYTDQSDWLDGRIHEFHDFVYMYAALEFVRIHKYTEFDSNNVCKSNSGLCIRDLDATAKWYNTKARYHLSYYAYQFEKNSGLYTSLLEDPSRSTHWDQPDLPKKEYISLCEEAQRIIRKIIKNATDSPYKSWTGANLHILLTTPWSAESYVPSFEDTFSDDFVDFATVSDDAPGFDSGNFTENAVDLGVCYDETLVEEEEAPCASCIPNPNAIVPNWTSPKAGPTFLNEKICEYSAIVATDLLVPPTTDDELSAYLEQGILMLLQRYKKQEIITVTYADGSEISANTIDILMGRQAASTYLGVQAVDMPLPYIADKSVSTVPLVPMKVLASIKAELFDLLPVDFSSLREEETPVVSTFVQLKAKDISGWPNMIWQVKRSFEVYAKRYSGYIQEMNYSEADAAVKYGDLDLDKEAENLVIFREDLLTILKHHGFNYRIAEHIKIGFKDDDGSENFKPYQIAYIEVNEPTCANILLDEGTWSTIAEDAPWNNTRTLAYVAKLPDIWMDVTAMVFPEWNVVIEKYTYGLLNSEDLLENLPENALDCFANDLIADPLEDIMNQIVGDALSFGDVMSNKFNKMLCTGEEFDRPDDYLEELESLWARAKDSAMRDAFQGDPVYELLDSFYKAKKGGSEPGNLWRFVLDKYGWCGILALIDMILGCLLKGVSTEDGLAIIIRAALKALGPMELEKLFIGLPAAKQEEIAAAVAEAMDQITAAPPWEKEYQPGNYSFGPEKAGMLQSAIMKSKGKKLYEEGATLESMAATESGAKDAVNYATYVSSLEEGEDGYMSQTDLQADLTKNFPDEYGAKSLEPKSYSGVGTIGGAADDVMDVIFEAYTEAIMDLVELDLLQDMLMSLPGAGFIGSLLSTMKCAIPPLFNPPLDDFMKTLELDFCRGNYHLTLPKFNIPDINWTDIFDLLWKAFLETLQNLILKAIFMLMKFILDLLFTGLCKLLGLVGSALEAALSDNFRETFRDALCGDESNPTSQLTDQEIDGAVAGLLASLSGCPTPTSEAATALVSDLSAILTDAQLIELLTGEATEEVLGMIKDVVAYRHPEFACALNSTAGISDMFGHLGALIPQEYKTLPRTEPMPVLPAYCADQSAVDEFYEKQCILLQQKGPLTEEQCNEIIDGIKDRAKQDIEALVNLATNGPQSLVDLPEVFADNPQCPGNWNAGLFPRDTESTKAAASGVSSDVFESLESLSQRDMLGTHGVLNMILAAKNGRAMTRHMFNLEQFPAFTQNLFPTQIAGHLKNRYKDFSSDINFNSDSATSFRTTEWAADEPPTFLVYQRWLKARCYPSTMYDSLNEKYVVANYGEGTKASYKKPDLELEYVDYKTDKPYSFTLEYNNFEIQDDVSVLNDYYKIRIKHVATDDSDAEDDPTFGSADLEWYEGFSGEQKSETEVRSLVADAAEGYRDLDVSTRLSAKISPKNAMYAQLVLGSWEEPFASIPGALEKTTRAITYSSSWENTIQLALENQYDMIFEGFMKKLAVMTKDSEAFVHGASTEYRGAADLRTDPDDDKLKDAFGDEVLLPEDLKMPVKLSLSGSHIDKEGMEWDIPPEVYGGTKTRNAWYIQTPDYNGWMGIKQTLVPDEIYTGCDPAAESLADFNKLADLVGDLYDRLPDDPRLSQAAHCAMEHPYNKILDRYSSAGLEGTIRATVRIYALEALIKGMPIFSNVQVNLPNNFDDTLLAHIADTIDDGLREQTQGRIFKDPMLYYLTFMEQVVQSFGKRVDLGDFEPTPVEQEAIDRLTGKADQPNPLNQDYWEKNDYISIAREGWPGLISAGIMTGVGSALGPAGAVAGALVAAGGSVGKAKTKKKSIWKQYISHPLNLRDAKILLRRYIREELESLTEKFTQEYKPVIDDLNNLLLVDPKFMIGSLGAGGPVDVSSANEALNVTYGNINQWILEYGGKMHPLVLHEETGKYFNWEPSLAEFWDMDEPYYWPFVLEKYVKLTELPGIMDADEQEYENFGFTDSIEFNIFRRLSAADQGLHGVVNFSDWEEFIVRQGTEISGKNISDLFQKVEFGLRVSNICTEDHHIGEYNPGFDNLFAHDLSLKNKAYILYHETDKSRKKFLMPFATSHYELAPDTKISQISSSSQLQTQFDNNLECLVTDLIEHPRYKLMFDYCFSLPRIMSIFTIYSMKAFLPSIGSADADDWETRFLGDDRDAGGGKWMGFGHFGGFRTWDWNDLFKKSKRQAKRTFEEYYNATDLAHESEDKKDRRRRRFDLNFNLNLGFNWLSFLLKMKRKAPFDEMGRPCPLVEEEEES
tara:strand:+ start:10568 stop:17803 length:7236 start_codon:yes stop_codon:yes gene_type:complete